MTSLHLTLVCGLPREGKLSSTALREKYKKQHTGS
jgi:hypothetical protein